MRQPVSEDNVNNFSSKITRMMEKPTNKWKNNVYT